MCGASRLDHLPSSMPVTFLSLRAVTKQGSFEGQGGAIYNRGDITVEGESSFVDNSAAVRRTTIDR